jgi:hypothetical protein
MFKRKPEKPIIVMFTLVFVFLTLFTFSPSLVNAGGGSIVMASTYPEDNGTYGVVDHFVYQITGVNTNTTVSVSIDDGPLISMVCEGIKNETPPDCTVACEWYTWQVTIPAITIQGRHTFQFFSHCYVWQDEDHYWSEFNVRSPLKSFTIAGPLPTPAEAQSPTAINQVYIIAALASQLSALLLIISFKTCRRAGEHLTS